MRVNKLSSSFPLTCISFGLFLFVFLPSTCYSSAVHGMLHYCESHSTNKTQIELNITQLPYYTSWSVVWEVMVEL